VIWEGIATDSSIEDAGGIGILLDGTEIKDPVVLSVAVLQELFGVLSAIPVETFNSGCWIAHDYDLVGDVYKVCGKSVKLGQVMAATCPIPR
jgi:hypothetical protein